jgi:hypothetical protein
MSKESTKAAFQKAFSDHMLLNLSPEQEDSLTAYVKSDERIRMEQQNEPVNRRQSRRVTIVERIARSIRLWRSGGTSDS